MIKYIIFDFDGVIVDSEVLAATAFAEVLSKMNINEYSSEIIASKYAGNKTIKVAEEICKTHNIKDPTIIYNQVMKSVSGLFKKKLKAVEKIKVFLNSNNSVFFIGSNSGKQRILRGLKTVGLSSYFKDENIYTFEMVENAKPSPDIYLKIIENNNLNRKEVVVLEDSVPGVRSAIAADLKVIGVTAASHWKNRSAESLKKEGSIMILKSYLELDKFLKLI